MSDFVWKHGQSKADALAAIQSALKESGYDGSVTWTGSKAEAQYGPFASIVHAQGEVTDDAVVLERCAGVAGAAVLKRCRDLMEKLFPSGGQTG